MSDIVDLSDADFAQKMEGLVHEAKRAMEGRSGKQDEEHDSMAPAPAPAAPPEPPAATPVPEPAPRPLTGLPDMLRPLVQGVQAVGRATGEHTQILSRIEKNASEAAMAGSELPNLVSELKTVLEQRNQVSRQMFDALHEELKTYKDGFLLDSVHRPMIRDLITLYDDLEVIHVQAQDLVAVTPAVSEAGVGRNSFVERMDNLEAHLAHNLEFILEVLARLEVQPMPESAGKLDKRTQRAVAVEIAEDPDQDMDIVRSLKRGFLWKDRVVRAEEVVVKKWKEGFLVALHTTAS